MTSTQHTLAVAVPVGRSAGRKLATLLAALAVLAGLAIPVSAEPRGHMVEDFGVGYFYQSFAGGPNVVLIAGGTAADVCETAAEDEVDPFNAEPGTTDSREFLRKDGSLDVHVNTKQPIYLYEMGDYSDAPVWINAVCDGDAGADLFAAGSANLKVRISFAFPDGPPENVFNSVNGKATAPNGTEYKVRAWADVPFENGAPVGMPEDWVGLVLTEIKR